jgi:hypothetical protein
MTCAASSGSVSIAPGELQQRASLHERGILANEEFEAKRRS